MSLEKRRVIDRAKGIAVEGHDRIRFCRGRGVREAAGGPKRLVLMYSVNLGRIV